MPVKLALRTTDENRVLWINILMDGPPAQSLGLEPADPDLTKGKPRSTQQKLLNRGIVTRILINAVLVRRVLYFYI